ncbi:hypothetical protein RFI_13797, partial [Reticulomyxa filosa]
VESVSKAQNSPQTDINVGVINQVFRDIGKEFLVQGLEHRSYFKNSLFGPSLLNGYAPQSFPIINDVLDEIYEPCTSALVSNAFNQTASVFQHVAIIFRNKPPKFNFNPFTIQLFNAQTVAYKKKK